MEIYAPRSCLEKQVLLSFKIARKLKRENLNSPSCNITTRSFRMGSGMLIHSCEPSVMTRPQSYWIQRRHSLPVTSEESSMQSKDLSLDVEEIESAEELLAEPLSSEQLNALLANSERERLVKRLSHANQQNRLLKRQLRVQDNDLVNFKTELAVLDHEVEGLIKLAEEIAQSGIPEGTRKINGKYIQSHLLTKLKAVHKKIENQIKDVDLVQSKEVPLFWYGMAESVQVMGTFDGWSVGEDLSPEYTGAYSKFSTTLRLRPGRYEIKFLVDGEWHLSPEFPTVGEGLMENNLLVVE
ncbi:protein PTST, chloroplastic [Cucurbita pepo subsp. pepo]|uniref:protein PTST, chloroplastic n=1 Tax=Cucurbita pepo subsp. pepo TaxID=3664 RepID=UPI000C9D825C|nr:protein PTST, chloroplastic [Cucurbita pepo subsp. pepo]XP_023524702.1 protein PTST, chloroplastic [Cucurbita pepo subsp. pepo]